MTAAVLAAALVALPGCSVSVKPLAMLSASALEASIARDLAANYHIPRPLVHCPSHVPARVGTKLTCTTELDGQSLDVTVTVTASHGRARLAPTSAIVAKGAVEAQLAATLAPKLGQGVQVFCLGPALLVVKPGHSFACTADTAGIQRQLVVTVTGLSGMLSYRVLPYKR